MDKRCSKCGQVKDVSEFDNRRDAADGRRNECRMCLREIRSKYHVDHREEIIKRVRQWGKDNKERKNESRKRRYKEDRERILQYHRDYDAKNREHIYGQRKQAIIDNPEAEKKRRRRDYDKHQDHCFARTAVSRAIRTGKLPKVSTLICQACGGSASEYHHYLGYAKEHWLDVHPYCAKCHRQVDKTTLC